MTTRAAELAALPALISVMRAAKILGISRSAAYRCTATGELPTQHLGGRVYIVTALLEPIITTSDSEERRAS